jgi:hypothetical protein
MAGEAGTDFVAECLWPDVREDDLRALDARAGGESERLTARGGSVRYMGSLLMREDEVVLVPLPRPPGRRPPRRRGGPDPL